MGLLLLISVISGLTIAWTATALIVVWAFRWRQRLRQVEMLEFLLCHLCVQAFLSEKEPLWRAWTATMGDLEVEVHPRKWRM
jgi:hypothetical protein